MKFLHTADWHLGKIIYQRSMIDDQRIMLNQLKNILLQHHVDVLLVAGDIYDRSIPTVDAVELLDEFLFDIVENHHINVVMISGNHDHADRLGFASRLLLNRGLSIITQIEVPLRKLTFQDEFGEINLYGCPFFKPVDVRNLGFEDVRHFDEGMGLLMEHTDIDESVRNLLMTHHFISSNSEVIQSESEMPLSVGGSDQIGYNHFIPFDYVALGHLHAPQKIGLPSIRYSGSLLKYSVDEAKQHKGCMLIEMKEKGNLTQTFIPLLPHRDIRWIEGMFDDICKNPIGNTEDYVAIRLLDTYYIDSALQIVRSVYPNALTLEYKQNQTDIYSTSIPHIDVGSKSDLELFEEFYQFIQSEQLEDSLKDLFVDMLKEVSNRNHEAH